MEMMAKMIATLRRERGMTQEALAELLRVSSQTVSKWETQATCPDVALLPALADSLGVSIDALYGREGDGGALMPEQAADRVIACAEESFAGVGHDPARDGSFREALAQYRRAMAADARTRSVIENDRDVLYYRPALGALALRKPEGGWSSLFGAQENLALLRLLAEGDFRRAMQVVISRRMLIFTVPTLAKAADVADPVHLEALLQASGLFSRREMLLDEAPLVYYELTQGETKLHLLYAVLAFAQELVSYEPVHYCFVGNMNYFTP